MTLALFKVVLYPRHFEHPPISSQWGKDNDHRASQEYLKHAKSHPYYHQVQLQLFFGMVGVTLLCTLQKELQLKEFGWIPSGVNVA